MPSLIDVLADPRFLWTECSAASVVAATAG